MSDKEGGPSEDRDYPLHPTVLGSPEELPCPAVKRLHLQPTSVCVGEVMVVVMVNWGLWMRTVGDSFKAATAKSKSAGSDWAEKQTGRLEM